jgi:hypothetical protein
MDAGLLPHEGQVKNRFCRVELPRRQLSGRLRPKTEAVYGRARVAAVEPSHRKAECVP